MTVWVEDTTFTYSGYGTTRFRNRSGDTLTELFYHLYFNAFQPGSAMHQRAKAIHSQLATQIEKLTPEEYGFLEMTEVVVNNQPAVVHRFGTIARIDLAAPIYPEDSVIVRFHFRGQIPLLLERAGRTNFQNIKFSMAQWYPKLCQYDHHGWHNNQYIGREFYGIWGDYDVTLYLPAKYTVGATGELQNPEEVGHGYQFQGDTLVLKPQPLSSDSILKWHFVARKVHDFAWVADDQYAHQIIHFDSLQIHILFKRYRASEWKDVPRWIVETFRFFNSRYSPYPYRTFTCAQAGDGGMEYPQLIMITHRPRRWLLSVIVHEIGHQWFYGMVANNETKHAWMDEGFTTYITDRALQEVFAEERTVERSWLEKLLVPSYPTGIAANLSHLYVAHSGFEEPLTLPHDRFRDAFAARQVYSKGAALLRQLEESFGKDALDSLLYRYVQKWKFRHPYPEDFEKECEMFFQQRLDPFFDSFLRETDMPNYSIEDATFYQIAENRWQTVIRFAKENRAHLPLSFYLETAEGVQYKYAIPVDIPYSSQRTSLEPWFWTNPTHTVSIETAAPIRKIFLDTSGKLIDRYAGDNIYRNRWFLPSIPPVKVGLFVNYWKAQPLRYYGISIRPTLWYVPKDQCQIGIRADGLIDFARYNTTGGLYYNLRDHKLNWLARFAHPFPPLGADGRIATVFSRMENVELLALSLLSTAPRQHFYHPLRIAYAISLDMWRFPQNSYWSDFGAKHTLYSISVAVQATSTRRNSLWFLWSAGFTHFASSPAGELWQGSSSLSLLAEHRFTDQSHFQPVLRIGVIGNFWDSNRWIWQQLSRAPRMAEYRNPFYRFLSYINDKIGTHLFLPGWLRISPEPLPFLSRYAIGMSFSVESMPILTLLARHRLLSPFFFEPWVGVLAAENSLSTDRGTRKWQAVGEIGFDIQFSIASLLPDIQLLLPPDYPSLDVFLRIPLSQLRWKNPRWEIDSPRILWFGVSTQFENIQNVFSL